MAAEVKLDVRLVRKLREDRGWSQEHLAAVSGLSARTIQRLETEGNASLESRSALAAAFKVEPVQLNSDRGSDNAAARAGQEETGVVAGSGANPPGESGFGVFKWALLLCVAIPGVLFISLMLGKFIYYLTH